jgi:hypothetical protein
MQDHRAVDGAGCRCGHRRTFSSDFSSAPRAQRSGKDCYHHFVLYVNNFKVFERSRFSAEVGAAIHVAPNCQRLLMRLGLSTADHGGTPLERVSNLLVSFTHNLDSRLTLVLLQSSLFMHIQGRELPRCP